MSLKINYWGVRGSLPSAPTPDQWVSYISRVLHSFVKIGKISSEGISEFIKSHNIPQLGGYGTHTTCVELQSPKTQIIIDGGSGLRNLGEKLIQGPAGKGQAKIHIFMTHFHWDHLLGVPFFIPHFIKGNEINYYAVQPDLEDCIRIKFQKPLFPVTFESLPSTIKFHKLEPRESFKLNDITVTPYQLDHPDPCWGFKVESGGRTYAHCVDTEGTRTTPEALGEDLPLYQGVDLMYYDAQYTLPELAEKANWGHSAAQLGLDIAFREGISHVLFAHHDPGASIDQIDELKRQTREYYDWRLKAASSNHGQLPEVRWRYAYEGLSVDLDQLVRNSK